MAQTIEAQREADERAAAIAELKRQRGEVVARLAQLDGKVEQLENDDFNVRLGRVELATMNARQKSEVVARIGYEQFKDLLLSGR